MIRADHLSRLKELYNAEAPNDWESFSESRFREGIIRMPSSKRAMFARYMPLENLSSIDRLKCTCGIVHAKQRHDVINISCCECGEDFQVAEECTKKNQKMDRMKILSLRKGQRKGKSAEDYENDTSEWLCLDCKPATEYEDGDHDSELLDRAEEI